MSELENRIEVFEEQYLSRIKHWAGFIDASELDDVIATLGDLETQSQAISGDLDRAGEKKTIRRWQALLNNISVLLPGLQEHLQQVRDQSRANMRMLGKGQRGLVGYRQALPRERKIFDHDG